jgi:hypothetical protein
MYFYWIWEILPFYKILVKPWDVDRGILREAQGTLGREYYLAAVTITGDRAAK